MKKKFDKSKYTYMGAKYGWVRTGSDSYKMYNLFNILFIIAFVYWLLHDLGVIKG